MTRPPRPAMPPRPTPPKRPAPPRRGPAPLPALDRADLPHVLADAGASGDVEKDKDRVYEKLGAGLREEEARQRAKVARNGEGSYYFVVVCASDADAKALQDKMTGGEAFADYVDGRVVAKELGVLVAADDWRPPIGKPDKKLEPLIAPELRRK